MVLSLVGWGGGKASNVNVTYSLGKRNCPEGENDLILNEIMTVLLQGFIMTKHSTSNYINTK